MVAKGLGSGGEVEGRLGGAQEVFRAVILSVMVEPRHCVFVTGHEMYNTKSEPSCKLRTSVSNN